MSGWEIFWIIVLGGALGILCSEVLHGLREDRFDRDYELQHYIHNGNDDGMNW